MRTDPKMLRYLAAAIVVAALVAIAVWPSAHLVDSGTAAVGTVRETVEAEGRTRLRDRYVITAPVAAMARRLEIEPGDPIEAGQVLVVLDPVTAPTLDTPNTMNPLTLATVRTDVDFESAWIGQANLTLTISF